MVDGQTGSEQKNTEEAIDPLTDGGLIQQEPDPNPGELPSLKNEVDPINVEENEVIGDGTLTSVELPSALDENSGFAEAEDNNSNLSLDGVEVKMDTPSGVEISGMDEVKPKTMKASTLNATLGNGVLDMDTIRNIKVNVQAVLGGVSMSVSKLSSLKEGEMVSLEKNIGEEIDILANGQLIAHGEIVVIEGDIPKFGITITSIVGS